MSHVTPAPRVKMILIGAGSAITIAAASSAWLRLSLGGMTGRRSAARLRRGRTD